MPIAPGTRLGAYEIVAPLGAGGMGEVYRAKDTKRSLRTAVYVAGAGEGEGSTTGEKSESV